MMRLPFFRRTRRAHAAPASRDALVVEQFKPPVKHSRLRSWRRARRAVLSGVYLAEYLPARLRTYFEHLPQNPHPLPWHIWIDGTQIIVEPNPHAHDHPLRRVFDDPAGVHDPSADDPLSLQVRWLREINAGEAQAVLKDLAAAEQEFAHLTARQQEIAEQLEALRKDQLSEIAAGQWAVPATMSRPRRQRGRPRFPFPWLRVSTAVLTLLFLLCEAYQFALPYWDSVGVDSANLPAEWTRNPTGVLAGGGFALAASASIFLLFHWLFDLILSIYRGGERWSRTLLKSAWAVGLAALLGSAAFGIGMLRHHAGEASGSFLAALHGQMVTDGSNALVFVLLTVLVPLGVAYAQHATPPIRQERQTVRDLQRIWDAEQERLRQNRERGEEMLRQVRDEASRLAELREAAQERIRDLNEHTQAAERRLRDTVEAERRYAVAFASSLVAALEQDRFYFIQEARRRGLDRLLVPVLSPNLGAPDRTESERPTFQPARAGADGHDLAPARSSDLDPSRVIPM